MARDRHTDREGATETGRHRGRERGAKWQLNVALAHSTI